jgi:isopentenyl-diphosphate delta-isomerase
VATHVYPNETYEDAAKRGLKQELGISPSVEKILAFTYFAPVGNCAENEYCALLIGRYDGVVTPNPSEVSSFDYVSLKELKKEMTQKVQAYTPWFKIAL